MSGSEVQRGAPLDGGEPQEPGTSDSQGGAPVTGVGPDAETPPTGPEPDLAAPSGSDSTAPSGPDLDPPGPVDHGRTGGMAMRELAPELTVDPTPDPAD